MITVAVEPPLASAVKFGMSPGVAQRTSTCSFFTSTPASWAVARSASQLPAGVGLGLPREQLDVLVSLTAPVHPEPRRLFRWNNDFAWSYGGNVTDSIAERVKKAGGKVEGATLRVSLSWFNYDDLDLHVYEPVGRAAGALRDHIYFSSKHGWTGGTLDVDMNAGGGRTREAVENVVWTDKMPSGAYKVVVNNFSKRESSDVGFVIEVESGGKLSHFSYNKAVRDKQDVHVVTLHVKEGCVEHVEIGDPAITASNIAVTRWGLTTEQYVPVDAVTLSPNHWGDNAVGNKHTFFVLRDCRNDEPTRGIYNEFLHPRLDQHRKVFEVIGDKTKCQPTDGRLSGLGFLPRRAIHRAALGSPAPVEGRVRFEHRRKGRQ